MKPAERCLGGGEVPVRNKFRRKNLPKTVCLKDKAIENSCDVGFWLRVETCPNLSPWSGRRSA